MADPLEEAIRTHMKFMFSLEDAENVSSALHEEEDKNYKAKTTLVFRSPNSSQSSTNESYTAQCGGSENFDYKDLAKTPEPPLILDDGSRHSIKKRKLKGQEQSYASSDTESGSQNSDIDQSINDPHAGSGDSSTMPAKVRSCIIFPQCESTIELSAVAKELIDDIVIHECARRGRKRRRRSSASSDNEQLDNESGERMPKWEIRRILTGGLSEEWICHICEGWNVWPNAYCVARKKGVTCGHGHCVHCGFMSEKLYLGQQ